MRSLLRSSRLLLCAALGLTGCATTPLNPMERRLDADCCLRDMTAELLGKSHAELKQRITGEYEWRDFRKRGYRYRGSISIVQDGEHPPDGLLIVLGVSDGEKEATFSPTDRMFSVLPGQKLTDERTAEEQQLHDALTGRWKTPEPGTFFARSLDLRSDGGASVELPSGKRREGRWWAASRWLTIEFGNGSGRQDILTAVIAGHDASSLLLEQTGVYLHAQTARFQKNNP